MDRQAGERKRILHPGLTLAQIKIADPANVEYGGRDAPAAGIRQQDCLRAVKGFMITDLPILIPCTIVKTWRSEP